MYTLWRKTYQSVSDDLAKIKDILEILIEKLDPQLCAENKSVVDGKNESLRCCG